MLNSWGIGEVGIALDWQSRGQGFESPILHQTKTVIHLGARFLSLRPGTFIFSKQEES